MPSAMTTVFGLATPCKRAARFGVSPTIPRSCASPDPIRSPTTTKPGGNADTGLQWSTGLQRAHRLDQLQPGPYRPLGIVLMGLWVTEIRKHAIAHVLRDVTRRSVARFRRRTSGRDVMTSRRSSGSIRAENAVEPHEVREHHGDLAALGGVRWRCRQCSRNGGFRSIFLAATEFGYRPQQHPPMTK